MDKLDNIKKYLKESSYISEKYKNRYVAIFYRFSSLISNECIVEAIAKKMHPDLLLKGFLGKTRQDNLSALKDRNLINKILMDISSNSLNECIYYDGDNDFKKQISSVFKEIESDEVHLLPLSTTQVPIHPDRNGYILKFRDIELVAISWKRSAVKYRFELKEKFSKFLSKYSEDKFKLPVEVYNNYAVTNMAQTKDKTITVFSQFLGTTLEDGLRESIYNIEERKKIIDTLSELRRIMLDKGLSWQGYAPRNMFLKNGVIYLIDFEDIYEREDKWNYYTSLYWHKIWFKDCLTDEEYDIIFKSDNAILDNVSDDLRGEADNFEKSWLGTENISWFDRKKLLELTLKIEKSHKRNNYSIFKDKNLFGHQLGHFWGDFIDVYEEVEIFKFIEPIIDDNSILVDCLECFEMAMEADIIEITINSIKGDFKIENSNTSRLVGVLKFLSPHELADMRTRLTKKYKFSEFDFLDMSNKLDIIIRERVIYSDAKNITNDFIGLSEGNNCISMLEKSVKVGVGFQNGEFRDNKFLRYATSSELIEKASEKIPLQGDDLNEVLEEFKNRIAKYSISQSDKTYLSFPDSANSISAMMGAILGQFLNQNLVAVDRSAPIATFIELQVIEWLRELVGYKTTNIENLKGIKDAGGLWTTGGYMSNFIGIATALRSVFPGVQNSGIRSLNVQPAIAVCGQNVHYSIGDAADRLGIGRENVLTFSAKENFLSDPVKLEELLKNPPKGKKIFVVIGIAGNTRTTSIDNLEEIADICKKYKVWYHVDACHGGSILFNKKLKRVLLRGIERSDSVAIDPHKGLFTTYPSSYVLFKKREQLVVYSRHSQVVSCDDVWDWGLITPFFGSRGFESLKTWFMLKTIGCDKIGELVEFRNHMMKYVESQIIKSPLLIPLNKVDFYRIVFVMCPTSIINNFKSMTKKQMSEYVKIVKDCTHKLCSSMYENEMMSIDEHTLEDVDNRVGLGKDVKYNVMAISIGNPLISIEDIDYAMSVINKQAELLLSEFKSRVEDEICIDDCYIGGPAGWNY